MHPSDYDPMPMASVGCPRCGSALDLRLLDQSDHRADYAGVCTTPLPAAGRCGTVIEVRVTAHVFAAVG
jgi:hypothetical protein